MSPGHPKLVCPRCGVEMNQHAEKIVYSASRPTGEVGRPDGSVLSGIVLEEFHTCPDCGETESRRAGHTGSDSDLL